MSKIGNVVAIYHGRNSGEASAVADELRDQGYKPQRIDARFFDGNPERGVDRVLILEDVPFNKAEQILNIYPKKKITNKIEGMPSGQADESSTNEEEEDENELPTREDALLALDNKLDWPDLRAMASKVSDKPIVKKTQAMEAIKEYVEGMED